MATTFKKKDSKKALFFLNCPPLPPPLSMAWPLVEELFFAASLNKLNTAVASPIQISMLRCYHVTQTCMVQTK